MTEQHGVFKSGTDRGDSQGNVRFMVIEDKFCNNCLLLSSDFNFFFLCKMVSIICMPLVDEWWFNGNMWAALVFSPTFSFFFYLSGMILLT